MLINFRFSNCRSFYDEANLSLQATKNKELKDFNTFNIDEKILSKGENDLLKSAVIFGNNATGKSNILKALLFMRNVLLFSGSQITFSNEPFAFYENEEEKPSLFEVEFIQNKTYYKYGFTMVNGLIEKEWLYKRHVRIVDVFKREKQKLLITGEEKDLAKLFNIKDNTLFVSMGRNLNLQISSYLSDVYNWFTNLLFVFENNQDNLEIYSLENGKYKEQALKILKLADLGIENIEVTKEKIGPLVPNTPLHFNGNPPRQIKVENEGLFNIDLETIFNIYNKDNNKVGTKDIYLFKNNGFNSEGTVKLVTCLGTILYALDKGRIIIMDELDSKLHFLLADYILRMFNSIDKNPNSAQLICTAHNVLLMDKDLRRDQIYFTSKDKYGKSSLVSLSDFKEVRINNLFSKRYLAGFYSKLPDMNE